MLGQKGRRKIYQIGDRAIIGVRPPAGKFKAIAGLFTAIRIRLTRLIDMLPARRIAVIFRMSAVTNHKQLDIFKQPAACPKTVPLISIDLIEGFLQGHAAPF